MIYSLEELNYSILKSFAIIWLKQKWKAMASRMNSDKDVIELRRAEQIAETGFIHEIILHHAEGVNVLAKLGQDLPIEMCRRFAADTARYFSAALDDQTASSNSSGNLETWMGQTLKNIKEQDRGH